MPFLIIGGIALLLALLFGPGLWIARVMRVEGRERPDLPGTGGELARHPRGQPLVVGFAV